jgi:hypothetical protein
VAAQLAASQEGLNSMELFSYYLEEIPPLKLPPPAISVKY